MTDGLRKIKKGSHLQFIHAVKIGKVTVPCIKEIFRRERYMLFLNRQGLNNNNMEMIKLDLIIEKGNNDLFGRVNHNDNLIVENAANVLELEHKLKQLLHEFEGIDPNHIVFEHYYDVYALFEEFNFINISKFAKYAGINPGLMRQYASGVKSPKQLQAKKIEAAFHKLSHEINRISIYAE